jgi:high affinity sulfate transporter 1
MREYDLKTDLPSDLISGTMVGIMNIPQGMAYALLAGVAPVYGLYVSFFPVLLYFFFGTSRHIALGTFAVMSLMVAKVVDSVDCTHPDFRHIDTTVSPDIMGFSLIHTDGYNSTGLSDSTTEAQVNEAKNIGQFWKEYEENCKIGVAAGLTLMAGAIQLGLGILQLGFVSIYLSEPLTRAFTTGAAVHVFTSQVGTVLGLKLQRFSGPGKLVFTYIEIFRNIASTNLTSFLMTVICIVIIFIVKEFINPKVKAKIRIPIPIELFVVIISTVIAYYGKFHEKFQLTVVGHIPTGLRPPSVPPVEHMSNMAGDAFAVAIVGFAISVAQAKLFAKKYDYMIIDNQELLALGIVNLVSSFFNCFTSAASLSRSLVQEDSGGKTQVAGLVSCLLVLIAILLLGPLFKTLPSCTLAAIIIVALKGMFLQLADLRKLWFISKIDWAVWVVTFLATVLLDVALGLLVGVSFSLLTVIARTQRSVLVPNSVSYRKLPLGVYYVEGGNELPVDEVKDDSDSESSSD